MHISEEYKQSHGMTPEKIADTMLDFYARVDSACEGIVKTLAQQGHTLKCMAGCCQCCINDLSITKAEAAVIEKLFPAFRSLNPHPSGACPFLDDHGLCRIYAARPYICRTHGLPMRWLDETSQTEERDICFLNDDIDILSLEPTSCWTSQTAEIQLSILNIATFGDAERIPMRSFWEI